MQVIKGEAWDSVVPRDKRAYSEADSVVQSPGAEKDLRARRRMVRSGPAAQGWSCVLEVDLLEPFVMSEAGCSLR